MNLGESKTSRNRIAAALKRKEALDLRIAGATYTQIGTTLGMSTAWAYKACMSELKAIPRESAMRLRELELSRLDAALMAIWPRVTKGELGSIDRMVNMMIRRAKLTGIDAPIKYDYRSIVDRVAGEMGLSADETQSLFGEVAQYLRETNRARG